MPKYKLNPIVISCGMKGNKILKDHSLELPESSWEPGVAAELVRKGFLVEVEEKAVASKKPEPTKQPEPEKVTEVVVEEKSEEVEETEESNLQPEQLQEILGDAPEPKSGKKKKGKRK